MRSQHVIDLLKHFGDRQIHRLGNCHREIRPETIQHVFVIAISGRDIVELFFQIRGELIAHIFAEEITQEDRDQPAFILGDQTVFLFADVVAILNCRHNRRIGRRPPDAQLFHPFDQSGLGVARRRLGEMLLGRDRALIGVFPFGDLRQALVIIIDDRIIVAAFLIDAHEAIKQHHLAIGAQHNLAVIAANIDGGALELRGLHLRRNRALINQVINLALITVRDFQALGIHHHIGGPDTFMRLLRVLGLVFVHARIGGDVFIAKFRLDRIARGMHGLGCHVDPVSSHISNVARLIEPLRVRHRLARAHTKLAAGLLLQGRGHKGC